jgi:uncharacterized protein DUF4304
MTAKLQKTKAFSCLSLRGRRPPASSSCTSLRITARIGAIETDVRFLTAQDAYKVLMRDYIAPRLRELGFKGSGREFWLSSELFWAGIGFQASAWSDKSAVQFTVNIQVVEKDRWAELVASRPDPKYPERPAANNSYSSRVA